MEKINLPENVRTILSTLSGDGFEAFAVGGCVRDSILGRAPGDWDITTNAKPADIKKAFRHTVDTGIEHGTVTVLLYDVKNRNLPPDSFEVTTYRIDGVYSDGRHPDSVTFTGELREDLRRRDFTINAMAYNEETGIVDLFSGKEDLEKKVIRCVGVPDERFDEDALRILRAIRFAAQLGFSIDSATEQAITGHLGHLDAVSKERIYTEISKLLCSAHIEKLRDLCRLGLSAHIVPGFEKLRPLPASFRLPAIPVSDRYLRYALIFRGMEAREVKDILNGLKADTKTRDNAALLASELYHPLPEDRFLLKKAIARMTLSQFSDLLSLKELLRNEEAYQEACAAEDLDKVKALYEDILRKDEPIYMKDLVVTGADLLRAGVPEGPAVGKILQEMLEDIRRDPMHNSVLYLFSRWFGTGRGSDSHHH